ncbi:nad-Dependent epimerase/dehydratase [Arthrobacter sp. Hiyo4]|nr:nad-Dependent epimerase/dehydratase [Arthrobacter sp. Hiyo4]
MNPLDSAADTVAPRSILFLGGTGVISAAAAERAVVLGHRVTILNRGQSGTQHGVGLPEAAHAAADPGIHSAEKSVLAPGTAPIWAQASWATAPTP